MPRIFLVLSFFLAAFQAFPVAAAVDDGDKAFSADYVLSFPEFPDQFMTGRVFVDRPAIRFEARLGGDIAALIVHATTSEMFWLNPEAQQFSRLPFTDQGLPKAALSFLESDPCGAGADESIRATRLAPDLLQGRKVGRWRCEFAGEGGSLTVTLWHDPALPAPLRYQFHNSGLTLTLHNFLPGPQAAALFRIPPGYDEIAAPQGPAFDF